MDKRKKKFIDKVILFGAIGLGVIILLVWLGMKRSNRDYILPADFEGWVTIKYNVAEAEAFEKQDGIVQISINDSGYIETSSKLPRGWGRDRFFRMGDAEKEQVPNYVKKGKEHLLYIHARDYRYYNFEPILADLPIGTDTTMWEGSRIKKKSANKVSYQTGKLSIEYFYISREAKPLDFIPPENPNKEGLESTKDHLIESE